MADRSVTEKLHWIGRLRRASWLTVAAWVVAVGAFLVGCSYRGTRVRVERTNDTDRVIIERPRAK